MENQINKLANRFSGLMPRQTNRKTDRKTTEIKRLFGYSGFAKPCLLLASLVIAAFLTIVTQPSIAQTVTKQHSDCFELPNGIRFCPPVRVDELTQCVRAMERDRNREPAEVCRARIVASCRTESDRQFERNHEVRRPRLIDARANERRGSWNKHCPISLGYRYTPIRQPVASVPAPSGPDKDRRDAIQEAGGEGILIEMFDVRSIPSLAVVAGPCLCRNGTKPVLGFCSGRSGTYKPACARE